jgi:hypothetical protein
MADTKALGVGPDLHIVTLEEDPASVTINIFRRKAEVYVEKETFDPYVAEFKKTKGVKFTLSGFSLDKYKAKAYYVFPKGLYKQMSTLFKLPALTNLEEK